MEQHQFELKKTHNNKAGPTAGLSVEIENWKIEIENWKLGGNWMLEMRDVVVRQVGWREWTVGVERW